MIHWIASPDHPRLEPFRHVGDHDWLRTQDLFVAEGRLVVGRLIDLDRIEITAILVNRAAHDALLERLAAVEASVYVCEEPTLTSLTGFKFHRGCLALARRPAPLPADWLFDASTVLALEGVGNPDNIGGLFRTAAAFGIDGVLLNGTSGDPFYRKAVRTSMGAVFTLPFVRLLDWPAALEPFRARGFRLVALTPDADAASIADFTADLRADARLILLVGSEGPGLSRAVMSLADARVRIPIGAAVDSLNVTVAAGIALERISSRR
jgi:tRNA G18 (ribose-2'-O)-methylase SpoU